MDLKTSILLISINKMHSLPTTFFIKMSLDLLDIWLGLRAPEKNQVPLVTSLIAIPLNGEQKNISM